MLLTHGTTLLNSQSIESRGYFARNTYFLNADNDIKQAIFGTAGFALRDHPKTEEYVSKYCSHDLIIKPFKQNLMNTARRYLESKNKDNSPGVIYLLEAPIEALAYHKGFFRSLFLPTEVFSTERIPTSSITEIITLAEHKELFAKKYQYPVKTLEEIESDSFTSRTYHTIESRIHRLILNKK